MPPILTFALRTTTPTSDAVHGSVTLADVLHKLEEEHGFPGKEVELSWIDRGPNDRMKELGVWDVLVKSRQVDEIEAELEVHLVRLEA